MKPMFVSRLLLSTVAASFLFSCQKDISGENAPQAVLASKTASARQAQKTNTFYGPQMHLGDGKVRTFYEVTHAGMPIEIGFEITASALQGLPDEMVQLSSPFHKKAAESTPFNHVLLDWNPHGHEPFFYEFPHFDFHFYMTTEAERLAVSPASPEMEQLPPVQYWPIGYVPGEGGVPQMGKHWVNLASPEIGGGQPFTHTMIYGSYAGKFTFVEPMITRAFLLRGEKVSVPYTQPSQFMITNTYYPTVYNIYFKDGKYYVSLSNFVWRG